MAASLASSGTCGSRRSGPSAASRRRGRAGRGGRRLRGSSLAPSAAGEGVWQTGVPETERGSGKNVAYFSFDLGGTSPRQEKVVAKGSDAELMCFQVERPMGIYFEEKEYWGQAVTYVDELVEGSNAEKAGLKAGDVLRICTAVFGVRAPADIGTMFGANPNKQVIAKALFDCDGQSYNKTMTALVSNENQVDTQDGGKADVPDVCLVVERPMAAA